MLKHVEPFTTVDFPDKIAATFFFFGCNLRCDFCHNPELVCKNSLPTIDESVAIDFLKKRVGLLQGVCMTGGEALLTLKKEFLKTIKDLGFLIKIDTNGSYPEKLKDFIEAGLVDYVAMDVKSSKERYSELTGNVDTNKLEKTMFIISSIPHQFRTTCLPSIHTESEIKKIKEWVESITKKEEDLILQPFEPRPGKMVGSRFDNEPKMTNNELIKLKLCIK